METFLEVLWGKVEEAIKEHGEGDIITDYWYGLYVGCKSMQKDGDTYHPEREETYGKVIKKQRIKMDTPTPDQFFRRYYHDRQ